MRLKKGSDARKNRIRALLCLVMCGVLLCVGAGCNQTQREGQAEADTNAFTSDKETDAGHQAEDDMDKTDGTEANESQFCYEYEVEYGEKTNEDYREILCAILGSEELWNQASSAEKTVDGGQLASWSVTADGISHEWYILSGGLYYSNSRAVDTVSEEEAQLAAEELLLQLEWEAVLDTARRQEGNLPGTIAIYRMVLDGIPMLGMEGFTFTQEEEEEPLIGSYLRFTIGSEGICALEVHPAPEIIGIRKTYDRDGLSLTEEGSLAQGTAYLEERSDLSSQPLEEVTALSSQLIYMPYRQGGSQICLLPVYEIQLSAWKNGHERIYTLYMDAETGYVYQSKFYAEYEIQEWSGEK